MPILTKLIFTLPDGSQAKYSLSRDGSYTLGTAKACDITLADPALEQEHGKLVADETDDSRWFLQNLADGSISFLEDGSEQQIGHTHLQVTVTVESDEDEEEDAEEDAAAQLVTDEPLDNSRQLDRLKKAQEAREIRNATILIIACAILSFAAGVAVRLLQK